MVEASPSFPILSIDFPNQGPSLAAENTKEHPEKQRHAGTGLRGRLGVVYTRSAVSNGRTGKSF